MSKHQQQADSEIHEDQLLNFLVNRLVEDVSLSFANNAEIDAEDIYEVLVGATADPAVWKTWSPWEKRGSSEQIKR